MLCSRFRAVSLLAPLLAAGSLAAQNSLAELPANQWTLLHREDDAGGKAFARLIFAESVKRHYLWGTGGEKPARNVYKRFELESFDAQSPGAGWQPAFPDSREDEWTVDSYPPFRIYGQSGPDGLHYDEGPRLQTVGGYHATNRVRWWDFDGLKRPSPIHTFNLACWDSTRNRVLYYSDGQTFALDPATNTWADLEARNHPRTCRNVAWASLCYDPGRDRILLFGGGLATNPTGAAPTWIYDCKDNTWHRPALDLEPPPRCNAPIVYDPASQSMIMFGGYDQAAALNDTWVFDCRNDRWSERKADRAAPPMFAPAVAKVPGSDKILVCGNDARKVERHHRDATSANKETWLYDVSDDAWTPMDSALTLRGVRWMTAAPAPTPGVVLMAAFGPERQTLAFRYEESTDPTDLPGAPSRTVAWKYPEQKESLEAAPAPDPEPHAKRLASLPPNTFIDANPPGLLISKTWSTATIDTDRSEILYLGGGHSGYSGNDIARYSIADNRWSLDFPPRFPPFLEGTNAGIYGWSYGMMPFSQHTYLWYCYDPQSKTMLYLARPSLRDGDELQLTDDPADTFTYRAEEHGYASWVYDPAAKTMRPPSFGRPFKNPWHLVVLGTPRGVFAMCENELHLATVDRESGAVRWKRLDRTFPEPPQPIDYHYEFQPLVHDTKRNRLVQLKGDKERVDVYARSLENDGTWELLETQGKAAIGREAVYIEKHDTILWLGERLFALDCATNEMREINVDLPDGLYTHECALVYDPKHDLCVALVPRSFSGPMGTYLFRYHPAAR